MKETDRDGATDGQTVKTSKTVRNLEKAGVKQRIRVTETDRDGGTDGQTVRSFETTGLKQRIRVTVIERERRLLVGNLSLGNCLQRQKTQLFLLQFPFVSCPPTNGKDHKFVVP